MAEKKEVIIKVTLEGDSIEKTEQLSENIQDVKKESKETTETFGVMDTRIGKIITGIITFGKKAVASLMTVKGAIIATGIGAFAIIVFSLIQYFKRTQEGADKLRVIMAVLGQVVDVVMDAFADLGEIIVKVFEKPSDDLEESLKDVKEEAEDVTEELGFFGKLWEDIKIRATGFKDLFVNIFGAIKTGFQIIGKELQAIFTLNPKKKAEFLEDIDELTLEMKKFGVGIVESGHQMMTGIENIFDLLADMPDDPFKLAAKAKLMERANKLQRDIEDNLVNEARLTTELAQVKGQMDDATKSEQERLILLNEATEIQNKISDERIRLAREQYEITVGVNKLAKTGEEDRELEQQQLADLILLEKERAEKLKESGDKRSALLKSEADQREAEMTAFEESLENELSLLDDKLQNEIDLEEDAASQRLTNAIANAKNLEEVDQILLDSKIEKQMIMMSLAQDIAGFAANMFEKNKEVQQGFMMIEKALAIARIVMSTQIALASDMLKPWMIPVHIIQGAMATAMVIKSASKALSESNAIQIPKKHTGGWTDKEFPIMVKPEEFVVNANTMKNPYMAQSIINMNAIGNAGSMTTPLTEERVAEIAAKVVGAIPVYNVESESTDLRRKVEQRETRFVKY